MAKSKGRKAKFDKKHGIVDINEYRAEREKEMREVPVEVSEKPEEIKQEPPKHAKKRTVRRRITRQRAIVYSLIICVVAVMMGWSAVRIYKVEAEKSRLITQQEQLTDQKKALREKLKKVNDPDYIEEQARAKLKMIMPGETLYVLPEDGDK